MPPVVIGVYASTLNATNVTKIVCFGQISTVAESEDSQESVDSVTDSQKRREILSRRPSYRYVGAQRHCCYLHISGLCVPRLMSRLLSPDTQEDPERLVVGRPRSSENRRGEI